MTWDVVAVERRAGHLRGGWLSAIALAVLPIAALHAAGVSARWEPSTYLPMHVVVELGIALVGFATFAVQWYAAGAGGATDARARLLGAAFLACAAFETLHLLVFPGMPGMLGPASVERGIHYWLAGRYAMVGALVAAACVRADAAHPLLGRGALTAMAAATVALLAAVEAWLPARHGLLYRPGVGLTGLKIAAEAGVAALAAVGAALQARRWRAEGDRTALRLASALALVVASEACFSAYASAYDLFNLLGHLYALAAAALIFDGLFVTAVLAPYRRLDALRAHVQGELATTIARLEETSRREGVARAELEAAIAAVPDGIVVCSADGRVVRMNAAATALVPARPGDDLVAACERAGLRTTAEAALAPGEHPVARALRGELVSGVPAALDGPGGRRRWVAMGAAPTRGASGGIDGAVAAFVDIGAVQELEAEREDLLRAVSHDLRSPLQVVMLQGDRLERLLPPSAAAERGAVERVVRAARQMNAMIGELVDAARLESGQVALQRQPVRLGALVEGTLAAAAGALDVARVRVAIPGDLPPVSADPERLERVVVNLVANALKYSPAGSEVRVEARAEGGEAVVSVVDRGVGVDPDDLPRLFTRFYRGRRTRDAQGLGLGLYIVARTVAAHGGRAWAESEAGAGSTFRFTLPLADPAGHASAPA